MPRKPKLPPDDPEQSKRFIDMGREIGADASKEEFERAFKKMFSPKHGAPTREAHEAKTPRRKRPDKADT